VKPSCRKALAKKIIERNGITIRLAFMVFAVIKPAIAERANGREQPADRGLIK